jgi:hypothetical protein
LPIGENLRFEVEMPETIGSEGKKLRFVRRN